jgi:hypothetical protein
VVTPPQSHDKAGVVTPPQSHDKAGVVTPPQSHDKAGVAKPPRMLSWRVPRARSPSAPERRDRS